MVKTVNKINSIEENTFSNDIFNKLENALILKYVKSIVSIPFLKDKLTIDTSKELGKKAHLQVNNGEFSLLDGTIIDNNFMKYIIMCDMLESAKRALENDTENKYFVANIVKNQVSKEMSVKEANLSVEDLMAKLYSDKEEKGMVR